jgi:hypothetical protein
MLAASSLTLAALLCPHLLTHSPDDGDCGGSGGGGDDDDDSSHEVTTTMKTTMRMIS